MGIKHVGAMSALVFLVASIQLGCGSGDDGEPPSAGNGPSGAVERGDDGDSSPDTSKLGQLTAAFERGVVVPSGSLPAGAVGGLRFEQPADGVGFVFKFDSAKAAESALPVLLRQSVSGGPPRPRFGGVTGCGPFAWFTKAATSPAAERWRADVHRLLKKIDRPCGGGRAFSAIS